MSDCVSDAYGSADNSEIVAAINACCATEHADLQEISTKLSTISTEHAECCASILAKFDTAIGLLTIISNNL